MQFRPVVRVYGGRAQQQTVRSVSSGRSQTMRLSVGSGSSPQSPSTHPGTRAGCATMFGLSVALVALLAIPSTARAQAVAGTLLGNVTDASGATVPGATVTA